MTSFLPPHDLDAEAAVVASVVLDPAAIDAIPFLEPEHFYSEAHRRIYEASLSLHRDGKPLDVVTIGTRLRDTGRIDQVGGLAYLTEVLNAVPDTQRSVHYASIVYEKWRVRTAVEACQRIAATGYGDYGDAQTFLEQAEAAIADIAKRSLASKVESNLDVLKGVIRGIQEAQNRARGADGYATGVSGIPTGIRAYDQLTSGLHGRRLTVWAARPGLGKTSLLLQTALNAARGGIGVLLFSLEMPRDELMQRLLSMVGSISGDAMTGGSMTRQDWASATQAACEIAKLPIWIDDSPRLDVRQIRSRTVAQLEAASKLGTPLGVVGVDYLQWVAPVPELANRSEREQIGFTSKELKRLAKDLAIPVIALAALNRDVDKSGEVRWPKMSDIRDCGNIESDADVIAFLHRKARVIQDAEEVCDDGKTLMLIAKQRGGKGAGTVKLTFQGQYTRFMERDD